jgi:DNA-binding IclR family transcriptional regulator
VPKGAEVEGGQRYQSKSIGRALDILECFTDDQDALSLREISRHLKAPEASLFRILMTLKHRGYLDQGGDGAYGLSRKVLFGKLYERSERLKEVARPYLRKLASEFNETASLACLFDTRIQVLDSVDTLHEVRLINKPGRVLPPHCSSLGKAIAAFQTPELTDQILEVYGLLRRTRNTITNRRELLAQFEEIRARGYAVDREEASEGGVCIGAPIQVPGHRVVASISLSSPVSRCTAGREERIIQRLLETARELAKVV